MKVVILGAGRVGLQLAKQLIHEKKEVTIIERDLKKAETVSRQLDCLVVNDSANNLEALEKAETAKADYFISLTDSDETNMIACALVSSSFDKPVTIARVRNADYSQTWKPGKPFLGIDHIVNPEVEVARAIIRAVEYGAVSNIIQFETSHLQMRNLMVQKDSAFCDTQVQDIRNNLPAEFIIAVIMRDDEMVLPSGDTRIHEGDQIWLLAGEKDFSEILKFIDKPQKKLERVAIAGGGNIGTYILQFLLNDPDKHPKSVLDRIKLTFIRPKKKTVHIIESDYEKCKEISERFPDALVTNADISEEQLLEEGRFLNYDLLITATGNQEMNIITAAHARKTGIPRSMALVRKISYASMARELGIDVAVSINETLVNTLLKIMRRGRIRSVHTLADSNLEIIEMSLEDRPEFTNKSIKDIRLPKDTLIIMVNREGDHILPHGNIILRQEDTLLMIARKEAIKELE